MKKKFMLPCIAAVAIATFVGTKTIKSNACEGNALLMANVEALSQSGDAPKKSGKAIEINERTMVKVIGWNVDVNVNVDLKAALQKLIGQQVNTTSAIYANVSKYMITESHDQYEKNCVNDSEANCICSGNTGWIDKPKNFDLKSTRCL